jgi:hypothetical protein
LAYSQNQYNRIRRRWLARKEIVQEAAASKATAPRENGYERYVHNFDLKNMSVLKQVCSEH